MNNNRNLLVIYTDIEKGKNMEDKRIVKTKKNLKNTLIEMLGEMQFEQISVTELCRRAETSRITFYTHYSDKYALVDDIFDDMVAIGTQNYRKKKEEDTGTYDLVQDFCNVLDAILDTYYERFEFFRHAHPTRSPYLTFLFYRIVMETVEKQTRKIEKNLTLKYSPKKIAGFLCFGLLGFINECHGEKMTLDEIKKEAKQILSETLKSSVIVRRDITG